MIHRSRFKQCNAQHESNNAETDITPITKLISNRVNQPISELPEPSILFLASASGTTLIPQLKPLMRRQFNAKKAQRRKVEDKSSSLNTREQQTQHSETAKIPAKMIEKGWMQTEEPATNRIIDLHFDFKAGALLRFSQKSPCSPLFQFILLRMIYIYTWSFFFFLSLFLL